MIDGKYHFEGKDKTYGKNIIIDAAYDGARIEVMTLYARTGAEIECRRVDTVEQSAKIYAAMIARYAQRHGEEAPLTGKYAKLRDDLLAAYAETDHLERTEDGGTCNFDAPVLELERWNAAKIKQAAKEAGGYARKWTYGSRTIGWIFSPNSSGQGNRRTRRAEAISKAMAARGYSTSMYYQMD